MLGLREGSSDVLLVRSIVELGHGLGLRIVAEGVEDLESMRLLEDMGCDVVQGYFVSLPLAPEALAELCHARRGGRRKRPVGEAARSRPARRPSASA